MSRVHFSLETGEIWFACLVFGNIGLSGNDAKHFGLDQFLMGTRLATYQRNPSLDATYGRSKEGSFPSQRALRNPLTFFE